MTRHLLTCAALVALTMWAGSLWADDSGATPLTGRLVMDGIPQTNKACQATGRVLRMNGGLIEDGDDFSVYFSTDSDGYFSFSLPASLSADDQVVLKEVLFGDSSSSVSVNIVLDVVTTPYALVAAEAKKLVSDGDLILSDAPLLKCRNLAVTGTVVATNSLSARGVWARDFPTNGVNVVEVRDLFLEGSYPNRGRLRWFGKEIVVMEGKTAGSFRGLVYDEEVSVTFIWDGGSGGRFYGGLVRRERWLEPNVWTAPTDGFCTWVSTYNVTGIADDSVATLAGISIKHEDGGMLDVLPVGIVESPHDPITMTFPVRRGDVVTIRYTMVLPGTKSEVHYSTEMSLRFRPLGLDK